jgi:hypothetical protein
MSNKLKINSTGTLRPVSPSRSFDLRESLIMPSATNLNAAPMFYPGPKKVNVLWSSMSPDMPYSFAVMKFGNNSMQKIYGNLSKSPGNLYPHKVPNLNLTLDQKGNYKLVNDNGKSFKIHSDNLGNYVKYNNNNKINKMYM